MPISDVNVLQENTGVTTTGSTSCVVSVPAGTTAGSTVIVLLASTGGPSALPTGFIADRTVGTFVAAYHKSEVAAAETSWTFTFPGSQKYSWYACEMTNIEPAVAADVSAGAVGLSASNGGTVTSPTTPTTAALDVVVFAALAGQMLATETQSWSGWTSDFVEVADVGDPNTVRTLGVARRFVQGQTGTFTSTATFATTGSTTTADALTIAYAAADARVVAPLHVLDGFEWGTHGGISSHTGSTAMTGAVFGNAGGTWGTNHLIQASSARASSYGLRIVQSGAAGYVRTGAMSSAAAVGGCNVRVVSATGTVVVASVTTNTGSHLAELVYDTTNSQFGVRAGTTGTVSWQSGTTATNTWVWVDLRSKTTTTTWHADWRLETATDTYTDQTGADLTGQTAGTPAAMLELGSSGAQTMTADYDDAVLSPNYVAYPLGPHQIKLLIPDTVATVTYSGTPGNFALVTSNATGSALAGSGGNITTSGVAAGLDEVPPTISASADGVVQTTTAASDYLQFPMTDPTVAADEVVSGVRMLAALISTTGAGAGNLAIRGWDGTTETALASVSAVTPSNPTATSSTAPRWLCATWTPASGGWTATALAGVSLRLGFSGDATPDMGAEVLYLEYAVGKAAILPLFGDLASAARNPNTLGVRSVTMSPPTGYDATLHYEDPGATDVPVAGGTSHTETIDAADAPTVQYLAAYPAAEGVPPA